MSKSGHEGDQRRDADDDARHHDGDVDQRVEEAPQPALTRSRPSAASVPMMAERTAVVKAMKTLVVSASMISGLEKALAYHSSEKPCQSMACLPGIEADQPR